MNGDNAAASYAAGRAGGCVQRRRRDRGRTAALLEPFNPGDVELIHGSPR
jgi:hypothetical protein